MDCLVVYGWLGNFVEFWDVVVICWYVMEGLLIEIYEFFKCIVYLELKDWYVVLLLEII